MLKILNLKKRTEYASKIQEDMIAKDYLDKLKIL